MLHLPAGLQVFCPKCGDKLEQGGDGLQCTRGSMPLSVFLANRLADVYERRVRDSKQKASSFRWGGVWYCPGCGARLEERDGLVKCEHCNQALNEFLYQLIERHPHRNEDGTWR